MSFILQYAEEGCTDCQQQLTPTTPTSTTDALGQSRPDKQGFTYNEGGGTKSTMLLTGPLSEVYTKALNVLFAKKPLDTTLPDEQPQAPSETVVGVETLAMDEWLMQKTMTILKEEGADADMDTPVDFALPTASATTDVSGVAYVTTPAGATKPEVIEEVRNLSQVSEHPVYLVVVADPKGPTQGMTLKTKFIDLDSHRHQHLLYGQDPELKTAFEELLGDKVTIANGFFREGGLVDAIVKNEEPDPEAEELKVPAIKDSTEAVKD